MKGYASKRELADPEPFVHIFHVPDQHPDYTVPVQIIPDDGTHVVVTVEEREAVRALVAALDRCDNAITTAFHFLMIHGETYTGPTYYEERERVRAILGTNGDTHDD